MAFIDPIDANFGTGAIELHRVSTGENRSTYLDPAGLWTLKAEHNYSRRTRRVFRVDSNKITPDPFIPSQNTKVSASLYVVADLPAAGYTVDDMIGIYTGLNDILMDTTTPLLPAWLQGQS